MACPTVSSCAQLAPAHPKTVLQTHWTETICDHQHTEDRAVNLLLRANRDLFNPTLPALAAGEGRKLSGGFEDNESKGKTSYIHSDSNPSIRHGNVANISGVDISLFL